jgi:hypothetical protein
MTTAATTTKRRRAPSRCRPASGSALARLKKMVVPPDWVQDSLDPWMYHPPTKGKMSEPIKAPCWQPWCDGEAECKRPTHPNANMRCKKCGSTMYLSNWRKHNTPNS